MANNAKTFTDADLDLLSVRVKCIIGDWKFGPDGLDQVPAYLHSTWKSRCWASAVMPDMRPSKLLHEDKDGVQVWAVLDAKGNDVSTIVRYIRNYPSHINTFEKHVELLLTEQSVHIIKFAGAYATDSSICVVLQPLAGSSVVSLVEMKQCGPLPEAFLSVVLRSILRGLQALSKNAYVPSAFEASNIWVGSESVKLGTTFHFDWQPSDEARNMKMNDCIAALPGIISRIAGIPRERPLQADGSEELWAPGGFFPDAKYGLLAAAMWPLRFGKDTDDRVHSFIEACGNPDNTLEDLLKQDLIAAYLHLPQDIVYVWFQVQGEYERFKYARSFSTQRIFESTAVKEKAEKAKERERLSRISSEAEMVPEGQSKNEDLGAIETSATTSDRNQTNAVVINPEGSLALGENKAPNGKEVKKSDASIPKKENIQKIAENADKMSDQDLIDHLYDVFQGTEKKGMNEGIFKGFRGLQSLSKDDFAKVCREFHVLEKYRGAITRVLGPPRKLRERKGPVFIFTKKEQQVVKVYEPTPLSDTAKRVLKLAIDHWRENMKAIQGRNKLRTYIQGTIWGRIGKLFTAKAFEEWHVIVMTKKLYDKREELRAIFGRDSVKRIFKCWVDFVFVEIDAPPVEGTTTEDVSALQVRPKTRERRRSTQDVSDNDHHHGHHGHHHGHHGHHESHSPQMLSVRSPQPMSPSRKAGGHVKLPEISSATQHPSLQSNMPGPCSSGEQLVPSPPSHKRVQGALIGQKSSPRHFQSPRKDEGGMVSRVDRLLLHEDRGILIEDYVSGGFHVHQIGLIDVPPELRPQWTTKGSLQTVREGLRLLEMLHRESSGVEVWSIADGNGKLTFSAVIYSRSRKDHCQVFHNHLRFLLSPWKSRPELDGAEPISLIDAYVSGKHIYVVLEALPYGNLSFMVKPSNVGPIPEPLLSVVTRQILHSLAFIHSHGVACGGSLNASSFWLTSGGHVKLGVLFHFTLPDKKRMPYAISDDMHSVIEMVEQLADARSEGSALLARHEFEAKIKKYELDLQQLNNEKNQIVKRQSSAQSSGKQDKKQQMLDDTRMAVLKADLKLISQKLEAVRAQINQADEAMRLFPLTYSTSGRCHDVVKLASLPLLKWDQVFHHAFVSCYTDVGSESLLRWVALGKGPGGKGNRLASTLYEIDPDVEAEIQKASQKPATRGRKEASMQEMQREQLMKIFQSYVVRGTGMDVEEHMDVNGLRLLMRTMFPTEGFSDAQIEDGFSLIDLRGSGKIVFEDFCEWWLEMKFSDKLGLRQQWKKELYESEIRAEDELEQRAMTWRGKNLIRRWRDRCKSSSYYRFKGKIIAQKHNFGVIMEHVQAWRSIIFADDRRGPGYGKSAGLRIKDADHDGARRRWGRKEGPDGEWEHGGAVIVDSKKGQFGRANTPGGVIVRSAVVTPNPGNFALRTPINTKNTDPQSKVTHAPLQSPRNQRTNLKGPIHEFKRISDSKFGDPLAATNPLSAISSAIDSPKQKSPANTAKSFF